MSDLILHHYPTSPFAEKMRTVLGYKKLAWKSVIIPRIMPKPDVVALTGGYRRTPLLQIGADIYCDTALICDVLEHRQRSPSLYPQGSTGAVRIVAQWADSTLFWAAMGYSFSPTGAAYMFKDQSPEEAKAFAEDRAKMRGGGGRMYPGDATSAYKSYLRRIASMVDNQPFVMGQQASVADFSCYHALWFTKRIPPLAGILDATPSLAAWMGRMAAFGHGSMEEFDSATAIALAANSTPASLENNAFQDDHGIALGSKVTITAESFGFEPTEGELVAATRTRYTLRRSDPRAGTVHVHFPRIGYQLRAVKAA
ncbi:MAG TPA: glutathione S-transferase family protein [Burkholderiales bacterium]|nr:glutathione S-transferase family protein [Burkholderiales bacterium]